MISVARTRSITGNRIRVFHVDSSRLKRRFASELKIGKIELRLNDRKEITLQRRHCCGVESSSGGWRAPNRIRARDRNWQKSHQVGRKSKYDFTESSKMTFIVFYWTQLEKKNSHIL